MNLRIINLNSNFFFVFIMTVAIIKILLILVLDFYSGQIYFSFNYQIKINFCYRLVVYFFNMDLVKNFNYPRQNIFFFLLSFYEFCEFNIIIIHIFLHESQFKIFKMMRMSLINHLLRISFLIISIYIDFLFFFSQVTFKKYE